MAEENTSIEKQGTFEILLKKVERGGKPLAALSATIYVIGYIVTSFHLAQYGVPIKSFIDAQYFAAGLLPGLLLWFTAYVVISAWNFNPRRTDQRNTVKGDWWFANILALILIVILMVMPSQTWVKFYPIGWLISILSGELSIAILIVLFKGEIIKWIEWIAPSDIGMKKSNRYKKFFAVIPMGIYIALMLSLAIFTFIWIPFSGPITYEQLPQSYGGGKLQQVQLYVDSQKVPSELLDANVSLAHGLPSRTIPLYLIYQTSTEYIVKPINLSEQRVWALKSDVVYAVAVNP